MSTTRGYLNDKQYQAITGAATLGTDADKIISKAEAIVDAYLGNWQPYVGHFEGTATGGTVDSINTTLNLGGSNYVKGCVVEMLSGDNEGEMRVITGQTLDGQLTVDADFATAIEVGDAYHVYQAGKVPRRGKSDVTTLNSAGNTIYVRKIPTALREAVAWQVKYMGDAGEGYFDSTNLNMQSESFNGQYSYTKKTGGDVMIAPRAKEVLRGTGLINRAAQISGY